VQVTCDGRPVALPPGTEGLLVLNISSYMGGVDLWRNGYSYSERGGRNGGRNGGGGANGGAPQSMMDGRVEVGCWLPARGCAEPGASWWLMGPCGCWGPVGG
jgi:diacylglycerol kinase (ATP)